MYYSQYLQDKWAYEMLGKKQNGFFVDIGASDGVWLSNTLFLEKNCEWTGICIEPGPEYDKLKRSRKSIVVNDCLASHDGMDITFAVDEKDSQYSGIIDNSSRLQKNHKKLLKLKSTSLNSLLEKYAKKDIDYLSIDTEGSEFEILKTFNFSKYKIKLITVEHALDAKKRKQLRTLLENNGFVRAVPSFVEDWYVSSEIYSTFSLFNRVFMKFKFLVLSAMHRASILSKKAPTAYA